MDFREILRKHISDKPFDRNLLNGSKSAYGMSLLVEEEFSERYQNLTEEFLNIAKFHKHTDPEPKANDIDFVVLWGVSETDVNCQMLLNYAVKHSKPILIIEDGFLRSFFPMAFGEVSASLRYDPLGCYYDCNQESSIENLLNDDEFILTEQEKSELADTIYSMVSNNITKYCSVDTCSLCVDQGKGTVLVIDQVYGDMSIQLGGAEPSDFENMLNDAQAENPDKDVIVKLHPETALGIRKGHYDPKNLEDRGFKVITENSNSIDLLKRVDIVYCATTQMGFEALMCGKEVVVYGSPFYAGWGVTRDKKLVKRRNSRRNIFELFYAAYIYQVNYYHPEKKCSSDLHSVIEYFISKSKDRSYLSEIKNQNLEIRIRKLEKKIQEIEPLKQASVTLDWHVNDIKDNYSYMFGAKLRRVVDKIKGKFFDV